MRVLIRGLLAMWMTTFVFMFTFEQAHAAPAPEGCVINVLGIEVCGTLIGQPLPEVVTVTADPIVIPGPTVTVTAPPVKIPGPTVTVTDSIPNGTSTVTVTATPQPGATATVTAPTKTVTETVTPQTPGPTPGPVNPVPTVTETVEVEQGTGQTVSPSDTVEPSDDNGGFLSPDIDFGDGNVTAGEAGVGLLGVLLILLCVLGGTAYGFRRGLKAAESGETDFLRTLLDRSKTT